jgi:hypothetical protein
LPATAASLVGAGMISVLVFPLLGLRLLRARETVASEQPGEPADRSAEREDFLGY